MTETKIESEIDLVEKVTKRLITLSSSIIVVLVTILGYYFKSEALAGQSWMWTTSHASVLFVISIIFGILVYGSLIGSIHRETDLKDVDVYGPTIRAFAVGQWVTFVLGIALLIASLYQIVLPLNVGSA